MRNASSQAVISRIVPSNAALQDQGNVIECLSFRKIAIKWLNKVAQGLPDLLVDVVQQVGRCCSL